MPNLEKNAKIREKRKQTLLRKKFPDRKFELKLDRTKISRKRLELLLRLFLEAKWFTNYFIANGIPTWSLTGTTSSRPFQLRLLTLSRSGRSVRYHHR